MADTAHPSVMGPARTLPAARPSAARLTLAQVRHANRGFLRTPVAAFFTLAFPLLWLVIIVAMVGNLTIPTPEGDLRFAQVLVAAAGAFSVVMASFTMPAIAVAIARERGVLKRLRGTPLPARTYLAGQIGSAALVAALGVAIMFATGVLVYGVEIVWRTLPAVVVTLLVGIGCFAALGMAAVALIPSSQMVQTVTTGSVVVLGFVSDLFTFGGDMPRWLEAVGWFFPLRHLVTALRDAFIPFHSGSGLAWDHLAVMAAWGVAGAVVAVRFFTWEPRRGRSRAEAGAVRGRAARGAVRGRRSDLRLAWQQVHQSDRTLWRDKGSTFFAVVFPVLLLVLMGFIWRGAEIGGVPIAQMLTPGMVAYGAAVTAFVNLPEATAVARDRGVLKRLRGTPLPAWAYLAGRIGSGVWMGLVTLGAVTAAGILLFGVEVSLIGLPALVVTLLVGVICLTALGLALVALTRDAKTTSVVALAILIPLSFLSGLFPIGPEEPALVRTIGALFPLRHFGDALDQAFTATSLFPVSGYHLAVMVAWGVAGAVVAARLLRWEPGRGSAPRA